MDQLVPHTPNWRQGVLLQPDESSGPPPPESGPSAHSVQDVFYALFRHKWLILFCSIVGIGTAAALYKFTPRVFQSEARLMVKYVPEMESMGPSEGESQLKSPILRGETVVNGELEILTSGDLARKVAEVVGPDRILARLGGGTNLESAALAVKGGLSAYSPPKANVIRVIYKHPDPTVVQPVLSELIDQYFIKHYEIHRALNLEQFERERDQLRVQLGETERKLRELMSSNSVFSLDSAKKAIAMELDTTQRLLNDSEMELARLQAVLGLFPTNNASDKPQVLDDKILEKRAEYARLAAEHEQLRARAQATVAQGYTPESGMVKPLRERMVELEAQKAQLEKQYPEFISLGLTNTDSQTLDPMANRRKVEILTINIATLQKRLENAQSAEAHLYDIGEKISELERQKEMDETKFRWFSAALDRAKFDAQLGSSRDSNIGRVQHPTPPTSDIGSLYKRMLMAVGGGVFAGIGLALLIEFFVDQRVKRPVEIRRLLPVPLYLSIPASVRNGARRRALTNGNGEHATDTPSRLSENGNGTSQALQPYFEALRDRILNRFEPLARKPKLVGICGCAGNSGGVTRLAAGLAGALSEAGDLKVLLVDMKNRSGKPHPILGTRKSCSLAEALQHQSQTEALVAPNLYVATAQGSDNQQLASSPSKFTRVVPQLNASDYDYIVFDMPEVDQVSITPRLSKYMDLTLLVVEAEKAHRNAVKQAGSLLLEFTGNVAVVLNNTKACLPKSLQQAD